MKRLIVFSIGLLCFNLLNVARAQVVSTDTAFVNSVLVSTGPNMSPDNVKGRPDGLFTSVHTDEILDVEFRYKSYALPISKKAHVRVYGQKIAGDSSAVQLQAVKATSSGAITYTSSAFIIDKTGITDIILPDSVYSYLEFTATGGGTLHGSKEYLIDAVALIEDFSVLDVAPTASVTTLASLQCYPNPVFAGTEARIVFDEPRAGNVQVLVMDLLGRTVQTTPEQFFDAGAHALSVAFPHPGAFFVQVLNDGIAIAKPARIAVEQ